MMGREWRAILAKYGQSVTVYTGEEGVGVTVRAFLQPVLDRKAEQSVPSPLGLRREGRVLYLGPFETPLAEGGRVERPGQNYVVQSAHPVGDSHWWAMLRPVERRAVQ